MIIDQYLVQKTFREYFSLAAHEYIWMYFSDIFLFSKISLKFLIIIELTPIEY